VKKRRGKEGMVHSIVRTQGILFSSDRGDPLNHSEEKKPLKKFEREDSFF